MNVLNFNYLYTDSNIQGLFSFYRAATISASMTYHCLPLREPSYKKMKNKSVDEKQFIWSAGCEFINRSGNKAIALYTDCIDFNLNQINTAAATQRDGKRRHTFSGSDERCIDERDSVKIVDEAKTIGEKEDKLLLKKFKKQERRNAICEMTADERHGFPRVLKHYIHLKTFHKCGLG